MCLNRPQMLREGSSMPFILKAMIPMHFKAEIIMSAVCEVGPPSSKRLERALKHWQYDSDTACRHPARSNGVHGPVVKSAQLFRGDLWSWLIANCNACDYIAIGVSSCHNIKS